MIKKAMAALLAALLLMGAAAAEINPLPLEGAGPAVNEKYYTTATHYEEPSLVVDVYLDTRIYGTNYVYAVIKIADASQLRTAMANKYNSSYTVPGTVMAIANNAVLAINGDFYNFYDYGYLVRQGKQYRNRPNKYWDVLIIDQHGDFHAIQQPTKNKIAQWQEEHPDLQAVNSFNFGPVLADNGQWLQEKFDNTNVLNFFQIAGLKQYARMAICQLDTLTYMFACCESVLDENSEGLTLNEWAQCLREIDDKIADYDIQVAYNIDGGGSATMVFHNEKINSLTNPKIRSLSDILYFASAWQEE